VKLIDAAQVLHREGSRSEALGILEHAWSSQGAEEFPALLAILEVGAKNDLQGTYEYLQEQILPLIPLSPFWSRRTLAEQATFFEWAGMISFSVQSFDEALEMLSRAASLGRDSSSLWRILGTLCLDRGDFELGVRYLKRSLQILRQTDLGIVSGREMPLGFFTGIPVVREVCDVSDYLRILLVVTKEAKGRKNLKLARELLMEMIHQFPTEKRLGQVRLMIERNIVDSSVLSLRPVGTPVVNQQRVPLISRPVRDL
jgi:tetratricopeptide (TPR) repeat protein